MSFDASGAGTRASEWSAFLDGAKLPILDLSSVSALVAVAAHPDDETLAAGGLIATASARGIPVSVIMVTDGSASNPEAAIAAEDVTRIRSDELKSAIAELSTTADLVELGFPDGRTDQNRDAIRAALADFVPSGATIASPWRGDGHRDHRVVGEVCAELAGTAGVSLLEFPIWMWHWARPDEPTVPWAVTQRLDLEPSVALSKGRALAHYRSQTEGFGDDAGDAPVLSLDFVEHFRRPTEFFIVTGSSE